MADYANLPRDILQEITKFLSFPDYARFSAVCSHWFEVANERYHSPQKQLPWLLFFDVDSPRFFNPSEGKIYQIETPELHERHCAGSSHGWLITIDLDLNINLLNPFSKAQVKLPLLPFEASNGWPGDYYECFMMKRPEERRDQLIYKAILSANPSNTSDYIVIAIYYAFFKLAFWRPGDSTWTVIDSNFFLQDIIWYNGAFYVIGAHNEVCLVEFGVNNKLREVIPYNGHLQGMEKYMVDFLGDLLFVYRSIYPINYNEGNNGEDDAEDGAENYIDQGNDPYNIDSTFFFRTERFMVFKRDQEKNQFIELKSINGHVLFLGSNHAMSIATTTMDKTKNDIIYFSDDFMSAGYKYNYSDSGTYNIRDKSITSLPLNNIDHQTKRPIFIDANPW